MNNRSRLLAALLLIGACASDGAPDGASDPDVSNGKADDTSTEVDTLLEKGWRIVGPAQVPKLPKLDTTLSPGAGIEMDVHPFVAKEVEVFRSGSDPRIASLNFGEGTRAGTTLFLPWREGEATMMVLPSTKDGPTTFMTDELSGCGVLIGENAKGEVVVIHINLPDSVRQSLRDAYEEELERLEEQREDLRTRKSELKAQRRELVERGAHPDDIDEVGRRIAQCDAGIKQTKSAEAAADLEFTRDYNAASDTAMELMRTSATDRGLLRPDRPVRVYKASEYRYPNGFEERAATSYLSGQRYGQGNKWTFRVSNGEQNGSIEIGVAGSCEGEFRSAQVELDTGGAASHRAAALCGGSDGSEVDLDPTLEDAEVADALARAREHLRQIDSFPEQQRALVINEVLHISEEVDRIYRVQAKPASVATAQGGLHTRLEELGVEFGDAVSERIKAGFDKAGEHSEYIDRTIKVGSRVGHRAASLSRGFTYAGRAFLVVGIGMSAYRIATADDKLLQTLFEGASWAGAVAGAEAATLAFSFLDVLGPVGVILDFGAGFVGGVLGAWGASALAHTVYDAAHPTADDPLPGLIRIVSSVPTRPDPVGLDELLAIPRGIEILGTPNIPERENRAPLVFKDLPGHPDRNIPVVHFEADPAAVWKTRDEAGYDQLDFSGGPGPAIGHSYFLPTKPGHATAITLPDGADDETSFVTRMPFDHALLIAEDTEGDAFLLKMPKPELASVHGLRNRLLQAFDEDEIRRIKNEYETLLDTLYRAAVKPLVDDIFWTSCYSIENQAYHFGLVPSGDNGFNEDGFMFVTGTLGETGWSFQWSTADGRFETPVGLQRDVGTPDSRPKSAGCFEAV